MFIIDWFWGILSYLGLVGKSANILFLGLDNAGKTTLLQMLKDDRLGTHAPTIHATKEELTLGSIKFTAHDLGGHESARKIWSEYFISTNAIVFLVDSADHQRFTDAKKELDNLLSNEQLADIPFLILGNKIDFPTAAPEEELRIALGLHHTTGKGKPNFDSTSKIRPMELFMCSVKMRQGYGEGFKWLSQFL